MPITQSIVKKHPDYDDSCGWWHIENPSEAYPTYSGDTVCDYAIIGAGWTGVAAAHRLSLLRPEAKIILVEAAKIGAGAAGRNSGFLFDLPFVFPPDSFKGREEDALKEISLYRGVIKDMREFVTSAKVDCDWSEIGQYHVAVGERAKGDLTHIEQGLRHLGEPFRELTKQELRSELGTDYYGAALHTSGTVQINPLALIRAWVAALPENVRVFENSPVTNFRSGKPVRVELARGAIETDTLLLTTNAFLKAFEGLKPRLMPVLTFAGLTAPLTETESATLGGKEQWGAVPAALFGTSMRRFKDGRFLTRNSYAYAGDFVNTPSMQRRARKRQELSLQRRFPDVDLRLDWSWAGVVSFFRGANGHFGKTAPGVYSAVSSGMPPSILYGQQLAEFAVGEGGDALSFVKGRSAPGGLPAKPFLGLAARSVGAFQQWQVRDEI